MAYTTPRTWVTGELVTAAMLNANIRDNENAAFPLGVDAWTTFTPTFTQGATITKTVTYAKYQRVGRLIVAQVLLAVTSAGTANTQIIVSLPVTGVGGGNQPIGVFYMSDTSTSPFNYMGFAAMVSTTTVSGIGSGFAGYMGATAGPGGVTLASGDSIGYSVMYEAAS